MLVFLVILLFFFGFKKKLKRGFFNDKSILKKNEYLVVFFI